MEILAGGLSAAGACCFTNPLEVVKNRLQLQGELRARGQYVKTYRGPVHGLLVMARTDGLVSLQSGLFPALLYQLVMNGLRLGTYAELDRRGFIKNKTGEVSTLKTIGCSAFSGVIGGFVGSPIFLVKTQLQTASSSTISVGTQHNHNSMVSALRNIYSRGGVPGLWQGVTASIPRISIGSSAQLVTYSLTMEKLDSLALYGSGSWQNNMIGAVLSGFVVAVVINPFDVLSTRLYNQSSVDRLYVGYTDCISKILKTEGPLAFYKGLAAQYFRIGPHSFLSLVLWHHTRKSFGLEKL